MAQINLTDLTAGDFAYVTTLNGNFAAIENELNGNLTNDNFAADANIDPSKINGGAITNADLTLTGEAGKIPRLDQDSMIIVSGISFVVGTL